MGLFVYLCVFGFFFFVNHRKHGFNAGTFIVSLYLLSAILAFVLVFYYEQFEIIEVSLGASLYHCVCLILFVYPLVLFSNQNISKIKFPPDKYMNFFSGFLVSFCILSLAYSIPRLQYVFSISDIQQARQLHNDRELFDGDLASNSGIFSYLGSIGHHFSFISLFFFFYYLTFLKRYRIMCILLFLSSFAIVFLNLSVMGRDGIIRWILFFAFCYSYFKVYLPSTLRKRISKYALIVLLPLILVFFLISFARFSGREQPVFYYLVSYGGQQYFNFSSIYNEFFDGAFGGTLTFPIFFPSSERTPMTNLNDTIYSSISLNTFPTFLGSFYLDMGFFTTLGISFLFFIISMLLFFSPRRLRFSQLVLFLIFSQIILQGLFYFMFYPPTVVKMMLLVYVLSFLVQTKLLSRSI